MTGRVSDGKEDGFVFASRAGERFLAPRIPVDGVVLVLEEIWAGLGSESVRHVSIMPAPSAHYARAVKAGAAYLLLPVTGLIAYLTSEESRIRFHGLQAIFLGLLWPVGLYVAALGPPVLVQLVFAAGAVVWLVFLVAAAIGRDPRLPVFSSMLDRLAEVGVRDAPRSTSGR